MASLLGALRRPTPRNASPVPLAPRAQRYALLSTLLGDATVEQHLQAYGSVGTLFAIVHRLSEATSQVEWKLWSRSASGDPADRTEVTAHPALTLWERPNPFNPQQEFVEVSQQHLDLTGEAWWVVARLAGRPFELWSVRPDRMTPVPHPTRFLAGYVYTAADGERVPLDVADVIQLRMPNPMDAYRGLGPVQAILADLDATKYSAEWNRNFFLNSAAPSGIIELPEGLDDDQWREFQLRWREQHQGVANAGRVGILEGGAKWVDRNVSQRDMQFAELRGMSSEVIREAFSFPKPMLGTVDDVNRANAEAGEVVFARWLLVPRLERIKQALNAELLPLFGATDVEFDYVNPIPEDREADSAQLTARADAASKLVAAGFEPAEVLSAVGLPEIAWREPEPQPVPDALAAAELEQEDVALAARVVRLPVARADSPAHSVDLAPLQDAWRAALDDLMDRWAAVRADQQGALADQVRAAVARDDVAALTAIAAPSGGAALILLAAMVALGDDAGRQQAAEAADQGVTDVDAVAPDESALRVVAAVIAATLAAELTISAVREAIRLHAPGADADRLAADVLAYLDGLSTASTEKQLGGALTVAQNAGRMATLAAAPTAAYYANETLDTNTCAECRKIDGKWLGNDLGAVAEQFPTGGYRACLGGVRCRGQVVAVWRGNDGRKWVEKEPV